MQHKLATWSTADRQRKFDRLLRIMADRSWLQEAARITLASRGARTPGIDGIGKLANALADYEFDGYESAAPPIQIGVLMARRLGERAGLSGRFTRLEAILKYLY